MTFKLFFWVVDLPLMYPRSGACLHLSIIYSRFTSRYYLDQNIFVTYTGNKKYIKLFFHWCNLAQGAVSCYSEMFILCDKIAASLFFPNYPVCYTIGLKVMPSMLEEVYFVVVGHQ